jgi:hypothetical protein
LAANAVALVVVPNPGVLIQLFTGMGDACPGDPVTWAMISE